MKNNILFLLLIAWSLSSCSYNVSTKASRAEAEERLQALVIDEPIAQHISTLHQEMLIKGGYNPDSITLRHCLHHTSGLFDYALGGSGYDSTQSRRCFAQIIEIQ